MDNENKRIHFLALVFKSVLESTPNNAMTGLNNAMCGKEPVCLPKKLSNNNETIYVHCVSVCVSGAVLGTPQSELLSLNKIFETFLKS